MRRLLVTFLLFILLLLTNSHDTLRLTPGEELSARYHFDLVGWEIANFPAKWLRELPRLVFPFWREERKPLELVQEYFRLETEARQLSAQINQAVATGEDDPAALEERLQELRSRSDSLRPRVEQVMEATISSALREEGIPPRIGDLLFPPVDFALERPPLLLVVSPRDRIQLMEDVLLIPDIPLEEREALEERIFEEQDLSALVIGIGGLATYPSIINPATLRQAFKIASHEWLHQYLFFRPLGQGLYKNDAMRTLNETTANIFGDELGNRIYAGFTGEEVPPPTEDRSEPCREPEFCFDQEMRRTRLRVEALLAQGEILEAEAYMEERRQFFVENGVHIRKLNQAYFARLGSYADNPASISPIFGQLQELRQLSGSLAEFIHTVSGFSSYNEFTAHLEQVRANPNERNQGELSK